MTRTNNVGRLGALCFDANGPLRLRGILFLPVAEERAGTNRLHLDLTTTAIDDQNETVATLVELGARQIDIGQSPDEDHGVLTDPEGREEWAAS